MSKTNREFKGAPTRTAYILRSVGGVFLAIFIVFPVILGGIRPVKPEPLFGYIEKIKSFPNFVYVSKADLNIQYSFLFLGLIVLIIDLLYEFVILPQIKND